MKIECVKNKLTNLISQVGRIAGKNQKHPVLGGVLLEVGGGSLFVSATNLDLGITGELPVRVFSEGRVVVPAQTLTSFLLQLPEEGNIVLEAGGGGLAISSKHSKTNIKLLNHEDFPIIPKTTQGQPSKISTQDLLGGLRAVWFAAATSAMKPELSGVYMYQDQKQLVFVATDSFRLAEKRVVVKKQIDLQPTLIPFRNVADIIRIFDGIGGEIEFVSTKNQTVLSGQNLRVVSRLIEGVFPDYQQIIPKNPKTEAVLLKQDLVSALKTAAVFSGTLNRVDVVVQPTKKLLEFSSENEHIGKNLTKLESVVKGEELSTSFNLHYLTDCPQALLQDSVSLGFNGPQKPLVLKGVGDNSFIYLVMPMNR